MLLEFTQVLMPNSPSKANSVQTEVMYKQAKIAHYIKRYHDDISSLQIIMPSSVQGGEMNAQTYAIANSVKSVANSGNV